MFYDRLEDLCRESGVTPAQVRTDLNISQSTMASWKSKKLIPKAETLQKLASYFDVDIRYLIADENGSEYRPYNYGARISAAREAAGLSQEQLAQKCNMSLRMIRRFESNMLEPRVAQFHDLAIALNTTMSQLLDLPEGIDEKNIWDTLDMKIDEMRKSNTSKDVLEEWLDELDDFYSVSIPIAEARILKNFDENIMAYIRQIIPKFTVNAKYKVLDYIRTLEKDNKNWISSTQSDGDEEYESELGVAEDFKIVENPSQLKNMKFPPISWDEIPHDE